MITLSRKKGFCTTCFKSVEAVKQISVVSLFLLILGVCSFGFFLPIWILYEVALMIFAEDKVINPFVYKCPQCNDLLIGLK